MTDNRHSSRFVFVLSSLCQGCQMVCFQTKNPDMGKFWRALDWKNVNIFYGHLVHFVFIWYIFLVLVSCIKKNLATLVCARIINWEAVKMFSLEINFCWMSPEEVEFSIFSWCSCRPGLPDGTYIFKPEIPIWVNFGGSCNGRCWSILRLFLYILWQFGIFYGNLE
jgi:hypothetical protein